MSFATMVRKKATRVSFKRLSFFGYSDNGLMSLMLNAEARDSRREAVNMENRNEVRGYNSFSTRLQEWESLGTQLLSRQTAKQTTNILQGLINYLLEEKKFSYILLRHIQSNAIENRFGWYRQLGEAIILTPSSNLFRLKKRSNPFIGSNGI